MKLGTVMASQSEAPSVEISGYGTASSWQFLVLATSLAIFLFW